MLVRRSEEGGAYKAGADEPSQGDSLRMPALARNSCLARGAGSEHVDSVMRASESVLGGDARCPGLHGIRFDLDRQPAGTTDEVVVVQRTRARAVERFALVGEERIGVPAFREVGKRAIDSGQGDHGTGSAETGVQGAGTRESGARAQGIPNRVPLPGVALLAGHAVTRAARREPMTRQTI